MSTAASVTMAADSTQGDFQDDKKKKKKSHKKYKKQKRRDSSSDSSVDSDLNLDKKMHPISYYVKDRDVLVQQLFKSITTVKLRAMLPEVLKPYSIEELRSFCLEQLEVMSKKRILRILQGEDPENISSSSTEDETDEEKEKTADKKEDITQPSAEVATSESVSEAEGTNESVSGTEEEVEEEVEEEEIEEGDDTEDEIEEVVVEEVEEVTADEDEEVEEVTADEEEEDVEYEEVEIEVEEEVDDEEEEGQGASEAEEANEKEEALLGDIRKVEIKSGAASKREAELRLHVKQKDSNELSAAPSVDKTNKAELATHFEVATSGGKSVQNFPAAETQKRRVKLKRDAMPAVPDRSVITKPSHSLNTQQGQTKRTVKAVKRKSTDADPLTEEIQPSTSGSGEIVLSKNQMEILELEMRARAIKAMLKMHSTE